MEYLGFGLLLWAAIAFGIVYVNNHDPRLNRWELLVVLFIAAFACLFWPITLPVALIVVVVKGLLDWAKTKLPK